MYQHQAAEYFFDARCVLWRLC